MTAFFYFNCFLSISCLDVPSVCFILIMFLLTDIGVQLSVLLCMETLWPQVLVIKVLKVSHFPDFNRSISVFNFNLCQYCKLRTVRIYYN